MHIDKDKVEKQKLLKKENGQKRKHMEEIHTIHFHIHRPTFYGRSIDIRQSYLDHC